MNPLTLEEVRRAVDGRWRTPPGAHSAHSAKNVESVSTDTRTAAAGDLFVALRGARFDGHAFLASAAKAGCAAAIVAADAEIPDDVAGGFSGGLIAVANTTAALGDLAAYQRARMQTTVIGVTGSNGKTTVKRMIHAIASRRFRGSCSPKSFNNEVGLPLTLLGAAADDEYVVCELGTNHPGEIAALANIARPDVAVITSVSEAHLEGLGSLEKVAAEKASILSFLSGDGTGVVWADSEALDRALTTCGRRLVRFGASPAAALCLTAWETDGRTQRFEINSHLWVHLPMAGRHNALNAMAALAVAQRLGMDEREAAEALADFQPTEMRMQWMDVGDVTLINDAYNANPASMLAAADVLDNCPAERKVMIAGDMGELGPQSESLHRRVGRQIAERKIDLLIGVGPLGRYIAEAATDAGLRCETFDSPSQAARGAAAMLRSGDLVLIKASRAVALETLVGPIREAFADVAADARPKGARR